MAINLHEKPYADRASYNAPVLYRPSPRILHHGYTVVTTSRTTSDGTEYQASLIVYTGPHESTQSLLLRKSVSKHNLVEALQDLLDGMEHDLGILLDKTAPGSPIVPRHKSQPIDGDKTPTRATYADGIKAREVRAPSKFALAASRPLLAFSRESHRRRASHDVSIEYLCSQGFAQPDSSKSLPATYHACPKLAPLTEEGYQTCIPPKPT